MLKLANSDGLIWAIIVVVVAIVKGLTKLQKPADEDSADSDDVPTVAAPTVPRPQPKPQQQPQPRPAATIRRAQRPVRRLPSPIAAPRPIASPMRKAPRVDADQIRRFVDQLSGRPIPPRIAPPATRKAEPPPQPSKPQPEASEAKQPIADPPTPRQSTRASQWSQALRDRQNIRNIVISVEILGVPRGESM